MIDNNKNTMYRPLWIEIDLRALRNNLARIKQLSGPGVKIVATVKQQAYGHGLFPIVRELSSAGVDFFGLGDLGQAIILRKNNIREPILILGPIAPRHAAACIDYRLTPTVVDMQFVRALNSQARKREVRSPVHIKIDTGMGRLGVWHKDAVSFVREVVACKYLDSQGLYTHFPAADTDKVFTRKQIVIFNDIVKQLSKAGIVFKYLHCANSLGVLRYDEARFNLVRPGLILYGIKPITTSVDFKPVLSLKSKVVFLKKVSRGRSISYARMHITKRSTTIATVAIGYADGYPWNLSDKGVVIIRGKPHNIVGRVCMDYIMVDVGLRSGVKTGDTVTLLGRDGKTVITANDLARMSNTIPYEIVSRLSLKIPRIYRPLSDKRKTAYPHGKEKQRRHPAA